MKKYIVLLFVAAFALVGCDRLNETAPYEEEYCQVSFNLVGEITTSDAPLTKTQVDYIYLVQIFKGANPFAMGIYDNPNFKFFLKKGGDKYRIIVSLIKNGQIPIINEGTKVVQVSGPGVWGVYSTLEIENLSASNENYYYIVNNTSYNSVGITFYQRVINDQWKITRNYDDLKFNYLDKAKLDSPYPVCNDWFYGEINDYSPTGEFETLNMELKRVGFKLKYELSGVTDGEVTVKVYNSTKTFIDNTTNTSTYSSDPLFYAFYEARNAWLYADDYMENFTLSVSWLRGIGITENYGTKTIQIKRNCLNNIKINLGSNDQSAGMNLTVEAESSIGAENITIPVE